VAGTDQPETFTMPSPSRFGPLTIWINFCGFGFLQVFVLASTVGTSMKWNSWKKRFDLSGRTGLASPWWGGPQRSRRSKGEPNAFWTTPIQTGPWWNTSGRSNLSNVLVITQIQLKRFWNFVGLSRNLNRYTLRLDWESVDSWSLSSSNGTLMSTLLVIRRCGVVGKGLVPVSSHWVRQPVFGWRDCGTN